MSQDSRESSRHALDQSNRLSAAQEKPDLVMYAMPDNLSAEASVEQNIEHLLNDMDTKGRPSVEKEGTMS